MAVEKPVARVDLASDQPRVTVDPQTADNGLLVGRRLVGVGERDRKEGAPNPRGVPVDLVHIRQDGVERRGPVGVGELSERRLDHQSL